MTQPLSREIEAFLTEHVTSMDDLAILAAFVEGESRWWDAHTLATHVGAMEGQVRRTLERFASRNLLDIRLTDDVRYQLRPGTAALEQTVNDFAALYRRSPGVVFSWVARRSRRSVSDFAEAFRIRPR
jgi:hypothetical protein